MGAVLEQLTTDGWQPVSFYSKKLDEAQRKYSTFGRALRAVYLTVMHFCYLLDGRQCRVMTVHEPLTVAPQADDGTFSVIALFR
jgi:elongation factor P hydroxylase